MATNDDPTPVSNDSIGDLSAIPFGGASATTAASPQMSISRSSFSAADVVESAMRKLVPDLQVRAEVEETLREMVLDVEIAHHLQDQASKHLVIQRLRNEIEQHKQMLDERTMLDVERRMAETKLADQLVRELWVLSEEMGQLKKVEAQHKELLMQHDEVVAQLLQAQEELADAQERGRSSSTNAVDAPTAVGASHSAPLPAQDGRVDVGAGAGGGGAPAADNRAAATDPVPATPPIKPEAPPESPPATEEAPPTESEPATSLTSDVAPPPEPTAEGTLTNPAPSPVEEEKEAVPAAPVVALEEEQEHDAPKLEEFEESILMLIFSFLDALDILNTAQVNISMYSRVDTLFFGNGNDPNSDDNSTIGTNENTASSATDRSVPTTAASSTTTSNPPSTPKASSSSASTAAAKSPPPAAAPTTTTAAAHSPTVVRLPPPATPAKPASAAATTGPATMTGAAATAGPTALSPPAAPAAPTSTPSTPASAAAASSPSRAAASGLSLFSSILQPRLPGAASATAPALASTKPAIPTGTIVGTATVAAGSTTSGLLVPHRRSASVDAGHQPQQQQPMNAAMANSMASKLSDAELNAIIVMTERLKSREQLAEKLRRENDELRAKLDGADALKEYLIGKVRDMEKSLSSTEEQDAKTALQIASDQEVIAFLDARVQELEAEGRTRSKELDESVRQRQQIKSDADQKVKVLSDMLQFERERVKENEVEWKATRKVLVKEVKNLRAQMAALVAERDGYREQNEQLRRAVVSTGTSFSNSASSPSRLRQGSFS